MDDTKFDLIMEKLDSMAMAITKVQLHIENVTDRNIQIVAENHLDLNTKLNESLKADVKMSDRSELNEMKINILEDKIKNLTEKVTTLEKKIS